MKLINLVMMIFMMSGCSTKIEYIVNCNRMPIPNKDTIIKIKELKHEQTDNWMRQLLIHKKKTDIDCEGSKDD